MRALSPRQPGLIALRPNGASSNNSGQCTDATKYVASTARVASDGFVAGDLTNNSNQSLYVSYTFARGGKPNGPDTWAVTIRGAYGISAALTLCKE